MLRKEYFKILLKKKYSSSQIDNNKLLTKNTPKTCSEKSTLKFYKKKYSLPQTDNNKLLTKNDNNKLLN